MRQIIHQFLVLSAALGLASTLGSSRALAYYSVINTGEMLQPQTYQVGLEPQFITNRYNGTQVTARFDAGLTESSSVRGLVGAGPVNFEIGGLYKIVPFPDLGNQPALGAEVGAILAQVPAGTEFSLRVHPMASKRLETEVGDIIPYVALPTGLTFRPDRTVVPIELAVGGEFRPLNIPNLSGIVEIGVDLLDQFGYISLAASYRFDDDMIHGRKRSKSKN